jgi:hypothetical protein
LAGAGQKTVKLNSSDTVSLPLMQVDQNLIIVLTVFVAIAAIALLLQVGLLFGMFFAVRKLQARVLEIWPEVAAITASTRRIVDNVEKQVAKIGESTSSILDTTKNQVAKVDELLNDATTRAKVQIERAEMVLDDTLGRAQETVSIVQRTVLRPIREVHGVLTGIRTTLSYLGRGGRPTVDHATADEEMFI